MVCVVLSVMLDLLLTVKPVVAFPANTRRWANVELTLGQRRRRWANDSPTLAQRIVFAGLPPPSFVERICDSRCGKNTCIAILNWRGIVTFQVTTIFGLSFIGGHFEFFGVIFSMTD